MPLLNQTFSTRDIQRQYKTVVSAVKKSNKPILVMNRSQAQLALINLKLLEEYQRLKSFAFLESIRAQNKQIDFNQAFDEITTEVGIIRQQKYEEKTSGSN